MEQKIPEKVVESLPEFPELNQQEIKKIEELIKQSQLQQQHQPKIKKEVQGEPIQAVLPPLFGQFNIPGLMLDGLADQMLPQGFPAFMDLQYKQEESDDEGDQHPLQNDGGGRRKNKKRVINNPNQNIGHWNEGEHKTYLNFLMAHKTIMESQDMKKTSKIFKLMSEIISSRTPSQCRSHHQKFNPFTHHIKKRQKGAGRKRKEESQYPKKNDIDLNSIQQDPSQLIPNFFLQPPQFYMPNNPYPLLQGTQNWPWSDMNLQPGGPINEDGEKLMMPNVIDQMMLQQLQQFSMMQQPQHQNQSTQQQQLQQLPNLGQQDLNEANRGQFYNFSFIQAPLNLSINYMPPIYQDFTQIQQQQQQQNQQPFMFPDLINDEQLQQLQQLQQFNEQVKHQHPQQ